jgi:hypothetical protein
MLFKFIPYYHIIEMQVLRKPELYLLIIIGQ